MSRPSPIIAKAIAALLLIMLSHPMQSLAGSRKPKFGLSGLSVFVDGGLLIPNAKQASFYDGRDGRPNTISRVLHSEAYGRDIWQNLATQGYLQGISDYNQITVAEYPDMYYKLTYQIGLGIRYDYSYGWGWLLRFDYSRLTATGTFLLDNKGATGTLTNQSRYIACDMLGIENRIFIDLALSKRFKLADIWELETDFGFNVNNTKVQEQKMNIGGQAYNVLDIWNGSNNLYSGVGSYDYVNQGSLGFGCFGSAALSLVIPNMGCAEIGYSLYYTKTVFKNFNENDAFAVQHVAFVRFILSGFAIFGGE